MGPRGLDMQRPRSLDQTQRGKFGPIDVSLYIPCYNVSKFLEGTLTAIGCQTYPVSETLVIDDGSSDDIRQIAKLHNAKYIRHEINKGLGAARNTAIRESRSPFLASLDADCYPAPTWLEALVTKISRKIVGVGGKTVEVYTSTYPDRWRALHMKQHWGDNYLLDPPEIAGSNTLFEKSTLLEVGGYDERLRTNGEDSDISRKIHEHGHHFAYDPAAVVFHQRKDTFQSVARSYWQYCNPPTKFKDGCSLPRGIAFDAGLAAKRGAGDLLGGNLWATGLPLMFLPMWFRMTKSTWQRVRKQAGSCGTCMKGFASPGRREQLTLVTRD